MDYAGHYERLISRARHRGIILGKLTYEIHHVVPRCIGGGEDRENLVSLRLEEHCIAHLLLAKMHPDNEKLAYAARYMSGKASHLKLPKNKRYARGTIATKRSWAKLRGNYIWRRAKQKPKRYNQADVTRLKEILAPKTNSA